MSKLYVWVNIRVLLVRVNAYEGRLPTSLQVSVRGRDGRLHKTHTLDTTWKQWDKDGDYMIYTFPKPPMLTVVSVIATPTKDSSDIIPRLPIPIHIVFQLKRGLNTYSTYRV